MARLKGQLSSIDLRIPFSTRSGGSVHDLRDSLEMDIEWTDSTAKDIVTGTTLSGSFSSVAGPSSYLSGYQPATNCKLSPGRGLHLWASSEFTLSMWINFNNVGLAANIVSADYAPIHVNTDGSSHTASPKFTSAVIVDGSPSVNSTNWRLGFGYAQAGTAPAVSRLLVDTYDNSNYRNFTYARSGLGLFDQGALARQIKAASWHHYVVRHVTRDGGRPGETQLWVDGERRSEWIGTSLNSTLFPPGGGVFSSDDVAFISAASSTQIGPYSESLSHLVPSSSDNVWLSHYSFAQVASWRRRLDDRDIIALYRGGLNGVYSTRSTSIGLPPLAMRAESLLQSRQSVGFPGSRSHLADGFRDTSSIIGARNVYLGSNSIVGRLSTEHTQEITGTVQQSVIDASASPKRYPADESSYFDSIEAADFTMIDGSRASACIRIAIPTLSSSDNWQFAGRADSAMAHNVVGPFTGSMFLSSALRSSDSSPVGGIAGTSSGIAGTGFLYYSPVRQSWIEKRPTHVTSLGTSTYLDDAANASNAIEVNTKADGGAPGGYAVYRTTANKGLDTGIVTLRTVDTIGQSPTYQTRDVWYQTKLQVTGVDNALSQFSMSPQLGYFAAAAETLDDAGYKLIGSPTVTFGAPFSPKYHAFDNETIKMSSYINGPFLLKKVVMKIPVEIFRRNEVNAGGYAAAYPLSEWSKNVTMRKDMDNYSFFLYRQSRTAQITDSNADISSSIRFLVASASVCVYNSASFGRSTHDGFKNFFGLGTPVTSSAVAGVTRTVYLNEMFVSSTQMVNPLTSGSLTPWSAPRHSPAWSVDVGLTDFTTNSTYQKRHVLTLSMSPGVVLGGYSNNSLMYVTTSTGQYTSSFMTTWVRLPTSLSSPVLPDSTYNVTSSNRLFNRFPQTGTYNSINDFNMTPSITTAYQNFWFGGNRQPVIAFETAGTYHTPGAEFTADVAPSLQIDKSNSWFLTPESSLFDDGANNPEFDIEIARLGLAAFNTKDKVFAKPLRLMYDGRGVSNTFANAGDANATATVKRTNLVNFPVYSSESLGYNHDVGSTTWTLPVYSSSLSVGSLSGSTFADILATFTVGYSPVGKSTSAHRYNPYVLLPTDELVLGLDAGVTPPPDIAPAGGTPAPDVIPGQPTASATLFHRARFEPFINPILREQIVHYAGNSYLKILPGPAEIILFGDFMSDQRPRTIDRLSVSDALETLYTDVDYDTYDVSEIDALRGTYHSIEYTGSFFAGTRGMAKGQVGTFSFATVKKFVKLSSDSLVLSDLFFSGVNEGPISAVRNSPNAVGETLSQLSSLSSVLGGVSIPFALYSRGQPANKRKPKITASACFRVDRYGMAADMLSPVSDTVYHDLSRVASPRGLTSPIRATFVSGSTIVSGSQTQSKNTSRTATITTPFIEN